jgi:hypothetical protein
VQLHIFVYVNNLFNVKDNSHICLSGKLFFLKSLGFSVKSFQSCNLMALIILSYGLCYIGSL